MKTYEQLMTHYWGKIIPMAEAAGINPWECVRAKAHVIYTSHPNFTYSPGNYTFALTVLEGRPVFVGDRLYWRDTGDIFDWERNDFNACLGCLCLTPPTKKRTFMLEATEDELLIIAHAKYQSLRGELYGQNLSKKANDLLTQSRDKE